MMRTDDDTTDHDEMLDDTLDDEESLDAWIARRTRASLTGALTAEDVADRYEDETGRPCDLMTITRILAHHYISFLTPYGEVAFRAALPH